MYEKHSLCERDPNVLLCHGETGCREQVEQAFHDGYHDAVCVDAAVHGLNEAGKLSPLMLTVS